MMTQAPLTKVIEAQVNGERWIARTNGYAALISRDDETPAKYRSTKDRDELTVVIVAALGAETHEVDLTTLTRFCSIRCGVYSDTELLPCFKCHGSKTVQAKCSDAGCTHHHRADCPECKGSGTRRCDRCRNGGEVAPAPARFDDSPAAFDRHLVSLVLGGSAPQRQIGTFTTKQAARYRKGRSYALVIRGGDALGVVMEYATDEPAATLTAYPESFADGGYAG